MARNYVSIQFYFYNKEEQPWLEKEKSLNLTTNGDWRE